MFLKKLSCPNLKVIKEVENRYWKVDENDLEVQRLIKEGKIKFAFNEKFGICRGGIWTKLR